MTTTPSRSAVLRATAWTAPVVAVAAAAPAYAASPPGPGLQLGVRTVGPVEYTPAQSTYFQVFFTNTGTDDIAYGALTASIRVAGVDYDWQGFSSRTWDYGVSDPDGLTLNFTYYGSIGAGAETDQLFVIIKNPDRSQSPAPVATLLATAPGYAVTPALLTVLY